MPKFNCTFSAKTSKGKTVRKQFRGVRAPDHYQATDIMKKRIKGFADLLYPRFIFGGSTKRKMSSLVSMTLAGAGPEEC